MSRRLAGFVFDTYDDVDGRVLRSVAPSPDSLPPFVKTAARLSEAETNQAPDSNFALVMIDEGRKLKKYACVDKGNTALSVVYLLKQAHLLPPQAVKIAASNLVDACRRHGLAAPAHLKTAAKTGMSPVCGGKSAKAYARSTKVAQLLFPTEENPKQSTINPTLGHVDGGRDDVEKRTNIQGVPGQNMMKVPTFHGKEKEKTAGVYGDAEGEVRTKQKSWRESPYLDMSGWDPAQAETAEEAPAPVRTLLDGSYPIDGYDQVKTAAAYFVENWRAFEPRKRHEYCVKLAERSAELGIEIPEDVERYGSTTYASDVDMYLGARRDYVQPEFHDGLELLQEKRAQISPEVFAEALYEFDKLAGLNYCWGEGAIADPWYSTFGPSLEKVAAKDWTYSEDGYRIHEEELKELALNGIDRLEKQFGQDFAKEFRKSPKSIFESMPRPNKMVIARMATEISEGM